MTGKTGQESCPEYEKIKSVFQCLHCCRHGAAVEHMALLSATVLRVITSTTFFVEMIWR